MIQHTRETTTPGTTCPTLCDKCAGSFTSHRIMNIVRRDFGLSSLSEKTRESLTICRCNYKGSNLSSVIQRPWVLVGNKGSKQFPLLLEFRTRHWRQWASDTHGRVVVSKLYDVKKHENEENTRSLFSCFIRRNFVKV